MTTHEAISMLEELKGRIAVAPTGWCAYCGDWSRAERLQLIEDGLRTLDLVIEKLKEEM